LSESGVPQKFKEIRSEIEKAVCPCIIVKIPLPEKVDKEDFFRLEKDEEFLQALGDFAKRWLKRKKRARQGTTVQIGHQALPRPALHDVY